MYSHYQNLNSDKELIDSSFAAIANHISYFFDFKGPSLSVDTMCSGSLSALHLAINSLRLGECKSALVGAVNIMSHPGKFRFLSEEKFLSPTGRCHSFGIGADGYVPGEGAVVLVLKLMKDAMKDENKIYGVIRGSSLNSVGHGSAFTVPSAKAQAEVIAKALEQADVSPNKISYIEAHGTGTSLGDPIEIEGLNASYGKENHHICSVGAVKSNIGHLESAAGLASIVKVLLQMHYRTLVPSLFCEIENPYLPLENSHLRLQKNLAVWGKEENCLYAGVSAFGAGGSNAHLILQSPPRLYQRELISKPGHVFNQQTYWAEALGVSKENKKIMPLKGNVDALLLQPHRTECVAPFAMYLDMPKLYICLESQAASVKTLLDNTRHQYVILSENHDWQQSLLSIIESDFTQSPLYLVNVCAYEPDKDLKQFSRLQFDLAKTLGLLNKVVRYQHFTCSGDDKKEFIYTKAYSALFRTLSLEKSNFNMLLVESDILLSDLIKNTEGRFCDDNIPYQHYIFENQAWYQQQYLEDNSPTNMKSPLLKMGGVYLLAGGLGAVGMLIADMLLKHYHATVILLGRSTLTGEKLQRFEKLSFNSGKVEYLVVDINVLSQVEQCITHIIECYGRLDGVIQSTCILNDSLLNEKSFQDFNNVIRSKIEGTINLDEATKKLPLDLFILFSSMSSVFGNVGQADYCVANTYLDHYSNYRTHQANLGARSGVSISINWPIWQVEGLTIDKATVDFICEVTGIRPLNEAEGVSLFDMVLDKKSSARIIPLVGDKEKIKEKLIFKQSLTALSTNEPDKQSVMENLKLIIEKVTKTPSASLTADMQISDLGFNSILLTEMANEIENSFEITVPPSAFFTYNDLTKITDYIFQKLNTVIKAQEPKRSAPIVIQTVKSDESDNDFAIIGLDGLLPGGPDVATFWQSLINNKSAVSRVERWQDGDYHAATIPDVDCFDAKFFGLSNREAMLMDPQHRLFLQTAYNTVLNAGYTPAQLANVGVFVGVQFNDYHALLQQKNLTKHPYAATGNAHAMLANRVSYLFNFHGPSQTIDTACSSALVAINRGLLALKNGECDAVLAGAVSLLIDPAVTDAANTMGILSPHYRCATFDEQADGYVRGEGVGCFLIKRLKDAKAANDTIHAVIKGFAENHGGKANSLTAPNPLAQKRLLLKAYDKSLAKRVSYIETHGTGTKLGDPVEIDALTQAFATLKPDAAKGSIYLGAVKTNVGHLEPAAGIPSIMKVIYALKYKFLPANINFKQQNPFIQLENTPFSLLTESRTWESSEPLVAGISSFGFGGSNAHLILMRYEDEVEDISSERKMRLFTLSARTRNSLNKMRQQLVKFLMREGEMYSLDSLSFTLNIGREHFEHRLAVVCDNLDTLIDALSDEEYSGIETVTVKQVASYQSDVHGVMRAYLQGEQIDRHILYGEISIKKIHLPGYCFDAKSFWFNETNEAALTELL